MTPHESHGTDRLGVGLDVAREAGSKAIEMRLAVETGAIAIETKGPQDFVTIADRTVEELIRSRILERFPEDVVIGEELGGSASDAPTWIIDPIDGTANYVRGIPQWCVSIALVRNGMVQLGIVYDAPSEVLYHAEAGKGAYRNGKPIAAQRHQDPASALAILGTSRKSEFDHHIALLKHLRQSGAETRRLGSAALGLAYVGAGQGDAYYEEHLNSWDALAGLLIAKESGALSYTPALGDFLTAPGPVLCGSKGITDLILEGIPASVSKRLARWSATDMTLET